MSAKSARLKYQFLRQSASAEKLQRTSHDPWHSLLGVLLIVFALILAPARVTLSQPDQPQGINQKELQKQMQEALKKIQEMQKSLPSSFGTMGEAWKVLQQQCTGFDNQNPLFLCMPVKVTIIDDINGEVWEQKPSGLLPNREPKYISHKRRLSYTAEGKGKLLYKKDFSQFNLLTAGTPETTRIDGCLVYTQGYHFEGTNARPVFYHEDLMTPGGSVVHSPFSFSILYPFDLTGPAEEATKNHILQPLHVTQAKDPSGPDQWGSQLPNENVKEEWVTPEKMKQLVAGHGFEKTYVWREGYVPGREWEEHRLTIKVEIGEPCTEKIELAIRTQDNQDRYCFSGAAPGKLEFTLEADVTPAALADEVKWELPDLQGSERVSTPADAKGKVIKVTYTNLPQGNSDFGPKTVKATVQQDRCQAQAQKELRFFFPTWARNNPGGSEPNWFYYWKQTSAALGPARFGGASGTCVISGDSRDLGYYRNKTFDSVYYVCDLRNLGESFPFTAKQLDGARMKDVRVTGIDTFAVACLHENAHYTHFTQWWKQYRTGDKFHDANRNGILDEKEELLDKDGDLVPDALEEGLHVDPKNRNTYGIGPNGDDEEFLCWMAETTWKIGSADMEDWAKPGKQWQ